MARLTLVKPSSEPAARRPPPWAHQFLAVVSESAPLIWRRIQMSHKATWWDLHVALQDAFAWEDRHLYEFDLGASKSLGEHPKPAIKRHLKTGHFLRLVSRREPRPDAGASSGTCAVPRRRRRAW